ncbi:MAG: PKD domain-containing protein [Bacteroidia bacterium]|nr:PKD domain-containing protein [Bacteroidia bacterium]
MKNNFYSFLIGLLLIVSPSISWATHLMGLDISYECTGTCTYRIYANVYYDCTGSAAASWIPVNMANAPTASSQMSNFDFEPQTAGCADPTPIGNWTVQSFVEVTPICPDLLANPANHPTGCLSLGGNPPINGAAEAIYYRDYDFCNVGANCNKYNLTYGSCCRNSVITSGSADEGLYTGDTQIDLGITPCNSSPRFVNPVTGESVPPIAYICEGQLSTFNQGAFDPDGDSLSYELGPCSSGALGQVTYDLANGFSATAPLGPTWDVTINPLTGDLTFTPSPTGAVQVAVICIIVKEWRNGVQIGQVVRDIQVTVLSSGLCPFPNPTTGGVQNVSVDSNAVGSLSYDQVAVCAGAEVCFDVPTIPADTSLNYTMFWGGNLPGATFVDANDPAITDTITGKAPVGRFCWTPPLGFRGTYFFLLTVQDDACPIPGINQFTIVINVFDGESAFTSTFDRLGCNEVELSVVPNNNIPGFSPDLVAVEWYGNGNLEFNPNINDSSFIHYYPAPDTYFYSVLVTDELGCSTTLTGIVPLNEGAIADAGQDVTICSNDPLTLGTPSIPGQTYSWSPGTNLSATSIAQPNFGYQNTSDTTANFDYVLTVSDGICTTFDYLTVSVNAAVEANIQPATPSICPGDSITLTAIPNIGDASSTTFLWSTGDTSESIRVSPSVNTTYSVIIFSDSAGGCSSLPTDIEVQVVPVPAANITGDAGICPGGSTTLTASGGDTYLWSTGATGNQITFSNFASDTTIWVVPLNANGCQGTADSVRLVANEVPTAFFDNNTACEGGQTSFEDASTLNSGNIVAWEWEFGDGTTSNLQDPSHSYTSASAFFVSLTVTSDNGCQDEYLREVIVQPSPQIDFNFTEVCEGDGSQFTSTTTLANPGVIDQYYWDFGDGAIDSGFQVTHTFGAYGFYNVNLTVTSTQGCSNTFAKTTKVNPNPLADFSLQSACVDSTTFFTNLATVPGDFDFVADWSWDFGDDPTSPDNFSTSINPGHAYASGGTYSVTMEVTTDKGCTNQIIKEIIINPHPTADFVYDQSCEDIQTTFTALVNTGPTSEIINYKWDLGNGQTFDGISFERATTVFQNFGGDGTYDVTLIAVATGNCTDTVTKAVVINPKPNARFGAPPVCLFDSTQFTNLTEIDAGTIESWIYDFGDNSSVFGANPSHQYRQDGIYDVTISVVSDSGCTDDYSQKVEVWELPEFNLFQNDTVCFGDQARLLAVSSPEFNVTWHLDNVTSEIINRGNSFITDPVPFTSTFYAEATSQFGCVSERIPVTAFVRDAESFELFVSDSVVEMPQALVNFGLGSTTGINNYSWSFGDGTTSSASDPSHQYNTPGLYEVKLDLEDEFGCEISLVDYIEVKRISVIKAASAFSPNNDGVNETFYVAFHNVTNFNVQIFNRTGQLIYESADPNFEWDGTKDGRALQEGVYVYVVSGNDLDGNNIQEVGTVTLLR